MKITSDTRVELEYRILDKDGKVVESSEELGTLVYVHGHEEIFPAVEAALEGHTKGDELRLELEPAEAFGEIDLEDVFTVPLDALPETERPEAGDVVSIELLDEDDENAEPHEILATVREINDDGVVIDANHPLAGQSLVFEVRVVDVGEAVAEA